MYLDLRIIAVTALVTLVNSVDKLQRPTRGAPVRCSPRPITRKGPGVNKSVTAWYFKVTGCTQSSMTPI